MRQLPRQRMQGPVGRRTHATLADFILEGDVDLPGRTMQMRLWTGGGSVANPDSAAEMRIERVLQIAG